MALGGKMLSRRSRPGWHDPVDPAQINDSSLTTG
jgi:hypothetical protein